MARLIDADALKAEIVDFKVNLRPQNQDYGTGYFSALSVVEGMLAYAPTVDAVSRGVHDQVRWERDTAIQQLEEHGIPFGGIAPDVVKVVRCRDCENNGQCSIQDAMNWTPRTEIMDSFCSYGERRLGE